MPVWLNDLLGPAAGAAITAVIVGLLGWRRARARAAALQLSKPVTFDAFLRANTAPYPRRWRLGWVTVNAGPPAWRPRFSLRRRPVVLPMSAVVDQIRGLAGIRERIIVNPGCRIIVASAGDVNLELAVFPIDLSTARQALESGYAQLLPVVGESPSRLEIGRVAEVVLDVVNAEHPGGVDSVSVTITGEGTDVQIVLIPHRQLGGFSLCVWADDRGIDVLWAAVHDLSTHDEIDLGVRTANIPRTGDWAGALRRSIADELARPITVKVRRGLLGHKLTCSISVDGQIKTMLIGRAPATRGSLNRTTLMSSNPLASGVPVPLENWRRWA